MACSAVLSVVKASKQWTLAPGILQSLRHDQVALDQELAAHFISCFGQLGDVEAAEAIFLVCAVLSDSSHSYFLTVLPWCDLSVHQ